MPSYLHQLERRRRAEKLHRRPVKALEVKAPLEGRGRASYVPRGAPEGTRIDVEYPIGIFGDWKLELRYPGEPTLANAAHVHCGNDRRLKAVWERNVGGIAVMQAFTDAFDHVLRKLGPKRICP